jgi:O-6-methylguanine DNA methyltransferase
MSSNNHVAQSLIGELRDLAAVRAPTTLLEGVLSRTLGDDYLSPIDTTIGRVFIAFGPGGVSAVIACDDIAQARAVFLREHRRTARTASAPPPEVLALMEGSHDAPVQFDLRGCSPFEQAVLRKAREIAPGEVRPYGWVAREIGTPGAARAVGTALRKNPVPLLIPCHRVVRGDWSLGEYALGEGRKERLLRAEGVRFDELELVRQSGARLVGNRADGYFCLPSCSGQAMDPAVRILLRSVGDAYAHGLRPCEHCRPAIAV